MATNKSRFVSWLDSACTPAARGDTLLITGACCTHGSVHALPGWPLHLAVSKHILAISLFMHRPLSRSLCTARLAPSQNLHTLPKAPCPRNLYVLSWPHASHSP
jgi:hypothetical protein